MFLSLFSKDFVESFKCDVCQLAKHYRATYPSSNKRVFILLIWSILTFGGSVSNSSISNAKWFITFIDGSICVTRILLIKEKSKVFTLFVKFFCMIKTQFGKSIKRLRPDNGR